MRKVTTIVILMVALFALTALVAFAEGETAKKAEKTHDYVGANKCKMCHKEIYEAWSKTPHASAFSKLSAEEQKKPECVGCHTTGKLADGTVLENVECEACHGPGADYKSIKIMSKKKWAADPDGQLKLAHEAGLTMPPTVDDCTRCHKKEGNPNFKEFNFEERKGKVHPVVAAEGK